MNYGDEGNPDDPIDYEGIGPEDPDPTVDFYRPGLNRKAQAKFDRQVARHHAQKKNAASPEHRRRNHPRPQANHPPPQPQPLIPSPRGRGLG